ncbi:MAG: hypothetical protein ACD_16C00079G0006 [uncultured bacterium]|nr:MAG: hypothetical protein ACD_16C00079G0006 [uncultured bacterium]OFW67960.1 MAG: uroporphyrinogen decarboxylase [Alphaproteobacteria bacterium GWC2_42_16]OFW74663.1 MAG: uroporphyrinogen decarboxylase [Alphaproteobacteria bacterium GWA2_41_27]OFW84967.1 MAG: uroporphyrinogen decarboxylase [Alphaproteobacteria bacterium RIFCSPHIGHO2_12_FULL_42_100]OFW85566.1 MAG: uroporphyrinogen decarboxylase [Alphaproteobacteria bacterium RBG_16_42_14]OFW92105.1 MAG: uroporphyrinogen decarboxylase [Alphap
MSPFLNLFKGEKQKVPPIWFMRQAGRYLPEYLEIRKKCQTFLELCYTPQLATTITLQPLKRFSLDAAILFSDILVVPDALGQKVFFEENKGPRLEPLSLAFFKKQLSADAFLEKIAPVYETIILTKAQLPPSKALLGFAGAPWTLALYMMGGGASRDFSKAKEEAFKNEERFSELLTYLADFVSLHLIEQVKAGVDAIQLFDTWAGLCPATHFERWVLSPTEHIVSKVRDIFPDLPIIGFPKGIGPHLKDYALQTNISALSLDASIPISWAKKELPSSLVLQGNLDPVLLVAGGQSLKDGISFLKKEMEGRSYIFNLGHGILPETLPSHVEDCIRMVKEPL